MIREKIYNLIKESQDGLPDIEHATTPFVQLLKHTVDRFESVEDILDVLWFCSDQLQKSIVALTPHMQERIPRDLCVTNHVGVRFRCVYVQENEEFAGMVADQPRLVVYDTRYPHTEFGQFVASYYVKTILNQHPVWGCDFQNKGLDLCMDIADWKLTAENMREVIAWLRQCVRS